MRSVTEYWYTTKEKLPKETDLCIGIRKNKHQFQISYKSGEWFDSKGKKIAEPDMWCRIQMPKEIFKVTPIPRHFGSMEEVKKLLDNKTYREIREVLHPYDCNDHYCEIYNHDIEKWILIPDDVVCKVDPVKYDVFYRPQYYAQITFDFNGKKCYKQLQFFVLPENMKTITITGIA